MLLLAVNRQINTLCRFIKDNPVPNRFPDNKQLEMKTKSLEFRDETCDHVLGES